MSALVLGSEGGAAFALQGAETLPGPAARLRAFLWPTLVPVHGVEPDFTLRLRPWAALPRGWREREGCEARIRESPVDAFRLRGTGFTAEDGGWAVVDPGTGTGYHFPAGDERTVVLYGSDGSDIHLLELVRNAVLLAEEARGTTVLHAAATLHRGACVLIAGDKGAGKTTTLMHLALDHGHAYFSGDKVLVRAGADGVVARGWPDYPYAGVGALRRFAAFAARCGVPLRDADGAPKGDRHKELIDPARFRALLGCTEQASAPVAAVILPAVSEPAPQARWLGAAERASADLLRYAEPPHASPSVAWHPLLASVRRRAPAPAEEVARALAAIPVLRFAGTGSIPPSLLAEAFR